MNIVVLKGRVSGEPVMRELASGARLLSLEVSTRSDDGAQVSAPVGWFDPPARMGFSDGDEVVVVGEVKRRFFRTAGGTQSRTEVVANDVVLCRSKRKVERVLQSTLSRLGGDPSMALRSP